MPEQTQRDQSNSRWTEPYSPLAWELALQADLSAADVGGVEALVALSTDEIDATGRTSNEAVRNLALELDAWARGRL